MFHWYFWNSAPPATDYLESDVHNQSEATSLARLETMQDTGHQTWSLSPVVYSLTVYKNIPIVEETEGNSSHCVNAFDVLLLD